MKAALCYSQSKSNLQDIPVLQHNKTEAITCSFGYCLSSVFFFLQLFSDATITSRGTKNKFNKFTAWHFSEIGHFKILSIILLSLRVFVHGSFNKNCHGGFLQRKIVFPFWSRLPTVNRGGSPRHIHPQGDDRCMDRGEGQLLKFVLSWRWHVAFLLKVHFQVGNVADTWAGLDQSGVIQRVHL